MKKTFWKACFRSGRGSLSRFLAIFAIVARGTGFLAGLLATTPDMRHTASELYHRSNLYDLYIAGNLGLDDGDLDVLSAQENILGSMPAHMLDRQILTENGDTLVARLHGVKNWGGEGENDLNRPLLQSGRWPENENECVVLREYELHDGVLSPGNTVTLLPPEGEDTDEDLSVRELTVVGTVTSGYYISMVQRGSTSIGNGSIGCILFLGDECFQMDYYTGIYLTVAGARETEAYSAAYDDLVLPVQEQIEALADTQKYVRSEKLRRDAQDALDDAQCELDDKTAEGQQELDDALQKLQDGETEYASGLRDWEDGKQQLADARQEIADHEKDLPDALKKLQDGEADYADGLAQYEENLQKVEDSQAELDEAYETLNENTALLNQAREQLEEGESQLQSGSDQLDAAEAQLDAAQSQLDSASAGLDAQETQLEQAHAAGLVDDATYQASLSQIAAGRQQLRAQQGVLDQNRAQLDGARAELRAGSHTLSQSRAEYEDARKQLEDGKIQWRQGTVRLRLAREELDKAKTQLADARKELDDGWAQYRDGLAQLEEGKADLARGETDLAEAEGKLKDARKELDDGWADYNEGKAEFDEKIADANQKILDAQDDIDAIDSPEWYVLTPGESNEGYIYYQSDTEKVAAIAKVFPVFFFLVAALVASTTMTRMIDEDRGSIGTLKALGYDNRAIAGRYLAYAAAACALGSLVGLSAGLWGFPRVIRNAYTLMYQLPPLAQAGHGVYILLSAGLILLAVMAATLGALRGSLRDCAAQLMRPKAPPAGKRILLERITPIWRRMKFTHKVTARNLFRYKKRFFMTIIGITGCTALLLTGFGLRDSINDIVRLQFGELMDYSLTLHLKHAGDDRTDRTISAILSDSSRVEDYLPIHMESGEGVAGDTEVSLYLIVPSDSGRLADFITFRDRKSGEPIPFTREGAILTEKAAKRLDVRAGDTLTARDQDGNETRIPISAVCENYVQSYLYIPEEVYETAFGEAPAFDTVYAKALDAATQEGRDTLAEDLLRSSNATGVSFTTSVMDSFSDMLGSVDYIVIVLIISAAALAFVVLYNLTNINICERQKEIATIKVLGFYPREVGAYVYRETLLLSLMGAALGLFLGIFFHQYVVRTAEVDAVMFGRTIGLHSYLYSAALTALFTLLVNLCMGKKLRSIDMVESLKAPE